MPIDKARTLANEGLSRSAILTGHTDEFPSTQVSLKKGTEKDGLFSCQTGIHVDGLWCSE
jgi:hypothetical protein